MYRRVIIIPPDLSRTPFYIRDRCNLEIERVFSADLECEISPGDRKRKH